MPGSTPSREELLAMVAAWRHERGTHKRAHPGTHARDASSTRMQGLDEAFERRLRAWVVDERLRQAWRDAFHHGAPVPMKPTAQSTVLFRGRSENGSRVVATRGVDGLVEVQVDGNVVRRLPALSLGTRAGHTSFALSPQQVFDEEFTAPNDALSALRAWAAHPDRASIWAHVTDLVADGLLDSHLGLTERGRRAVAERVPEGV